MSKLRRLAVGGSVVLLSAFVPVPAHAAYAAQHSPGYARCDTYVSNGAVSNRVVAPLNQSIFAYNYYSNVRESQRVALRFRLWKSNGSNWGSGAIATTRVVYSTAFDDKSPGAWTYADGTTATGYGQVGHAQQFSGLAAGRYAVSVEFWWATSRHGVGGGYDHLWANGACAF